MECPGCHHVNRTGAQFCTACRTPLSMPCPACGTGNLGSARFCGECGSRLAGQTTAVEKSPSRWAAASNSASAAERRLLTVMFCDLVGSTGLSARLDPEDMRDLTRSVPQERHRCSGAIRWVHRPVPGRWRTRLFWLSAGSRGRRGACSKRGTWQPLPQSMASRLAPASGYRPTSASPRGWLSSASSWSQRNHKQRVAIGETPNLAARLQAVAAPGEVVIAASTRRLVGRMFDCRALGCQRGEGAAATGGGVAGARRGGRRQPVRGAARGRAVPARWPAGGDRAAAAPLGSGQARRGSGRAALGRARHRQVAHR